MAMRIILRLLALAPVVNLLLVASCYSLIEDLDVAGDVRLRLRYVDSARKSPVEGTYGELHNRGFAYRHRFALEIAYPVSAAIRVGGKLRVSNEDEEVLRLGPEYLSSEFGSVFAAYETPAVRSRFGYYDVYYTPLSLMRWDVKDDPEGGGGGCAVCGAPGVAGAILGESLEELGPTLTFEGLWVELSPWQTLGLGASGFFTKSEIAGETYPVMTFGGRIDLTRYVQRASSLLEVAALAVRSEEDEKEEEAGGSLPDDPFDNTVYGLAWKVPFLKSFSFEGEWMQTESHNQADRPSEIEGYGGIFSMIAKVDAKLLVDAAYIYLSPNWDSYFRALSYNHNRKGTRIRLEYGEKDFLVALFAKYLTTIDAAETIVYPTFSARGYLTVRPKLNLGLAAIYSGEGPAEDGFTVNTDSKRITWLAALAYEFGKDSSITLEERYIQRRFADEEGYDISMLSLYLRAAVW
jgi:hypothetical protein